MFPLSPPLSGFLPFPLSAIRLLPADGWRRPCFFYYLRRGTTWSIRSRLKRRGAGGGGGIPGRHRRVFTRWPAFSNKSRPLIALNARLHSALYRCTAERAPRMAALHQDAATCASLRAKCKFHIGWEDKGRCQGAPGGGWTQPGQLSLC